MSKNAPQCEGAFLVIENVVICDIMGPESLNVIYCAERQPKWLSFCGIIGVCARGLPRRAAHLIVGTWRESPTRQPNGNTARVGNLR